MEKIQLDKAGLVTKKEGKYCVTSVGKAICSLEITPENTLSNYWKLKAIDSYNNLSKEEYYRFPDRLIDNIIQRNSFKRLSFPLLFCNEECIKKPYTD
jgi:hypothetical protein